MTNTAAALITITLACLLLWVCVFNAVSGHSRQTCNNVASVDVCEWELR